MSDLRDESAQVRGKKKEFPAQIDRIVPWGKWVSMIRPCHYKGERGNKPYEIELMLRLKQHKSSFYAANSLDSASGTVPPSIGSINAFSLAISPPSFFT